MSLGGTSCVIDHLEEGNRLFVTVDDGRDGHEEDGYQVTVHERNVAFYKGGTRIKAGWDRVDEFSPRVTGAEGE